MVSKPESEVQTARCQTTRVNADDGRSSVSVLTISANDASKKVEKEMEATVSQGSGSLRLVRDVALRCVRLTTS